MFPNRLSEILQYERDLVAASGGQNLLFAGVIWAHGMDDAYSILEQISSTPGFWGHRVEKVAFKSHIEMLHKIYGFDSVPKKHLASKAKYLLSFPPEALLLVFSASAIDLTVVGSKKFRHLEYSEIVRLKWEIRRAFNPRTNLQEMTHDHVLHLADTSYQSRVLLSEFADGYLDRQFPFLEDSLGFSVPSHLGRKTAAEHRNIPIKLLRIRQLGGGSELVPVTDSPHFLALSTGDPTLYERYLAEHIGTRAKDFHTWSRFSRLATEAKQNGSVGEPVVVRRESENYVVLDGSHRVAIKANRGEESIWCLLV